MARTKTNEWFNKNTPMIGFRLPDPELVAEIEAAALSASTSKSGWVRQVVMEALAKESDKQTT